MANCLGAPGLVHIQWSSQAGRCQLEVTMRRGSARCYTSHTRVAPDSQGTGQGSFSRGDRFTALQSKTLALADQVGNSETRRHGLLYYHRGVRRRASSVKSRKLRTLLAVTTRSFLTSRKAHMVMRSRITSRTRLEASNP